MISLRTASASLVALSLALVAGSAHADKIVRTDGKVIDDVRVTEDGLTAITYKSGNKSETLASDRVLRIQFSRYPRLVDEAEAAAVGDDPEGAVELFDVYTDGQIAKPSEKRYPWAPAYANWRSIQIRMANADTPGVIAKSQQLIASFPESRFVPQAYLAKAQAESMMNQGPKAKKSLEELAGLVSTKNLSKRWDLECRLGLIRVDDKSKADDKRTSLADLSSDAGDYPTVKNRILVAEGETWIQQAEKDESKRADYLSEARSVFEAILKRQSECEPQTLAGAYTGLGDVEYYAAGEDPAKLETARMNYLRVVIVFADEVQYVPKCLYQSLIISNRLEDTDKKKDMKRELLRLYPNSPYADKAKSY